MTPAFSSRNRQARTSRRTIVVVRGAGTAIIVTAAAALAVAAQHVYLWRAADWDISPAGPASLGLAALLFPMGRGLWRRQAWARGTLATLALVLALASALHAALAGADAGAMPVLGTAIALAVLLRLPRVKTACNEPPPRWVRAYYTYALCGAAGLGMVFPFLWMVSTSFKRPQEIFTSSSLLPVRHYAVLHGRSTEVVFTRRNRLLEVRVEDDDDTRIIHRAVARAEYPWAVPARARFYYLDKERGNRKVYFRTVRRLVRARVVDRDSPEYRKRLDIERDRIETSLSLRTANYAATRDLVAPDGKVVGVERVGAWLAVPMGRFFLNSLLVAAAVTFGVVFSSSLAGYAFARLRFPGRDKLFLGYLATMMIPGAVTMIPLFILMRQLGWVDSYAALIVPAMFSAYGTFMLRQFFMSIPRDLEDAAAIDGCGLFGIYWRIILPVSKPALATLTTFTFMGQWNNFLWPLVVTNSPEKMTLPVGLQYFMGLHGTDYALLMAGSVTAILPVLALFLFSQRFFIRGIQLGAIKG